MDVMALDYKFNGVICSDLNLTRNFIDDILYKLKDCIKNRDTIFDIKLILNELVINGVLHGNNCMISKCIKISLEIDKDKITIQVEDEGKGIDYDFSSYDPTALETNGRGLVIVSGLSDEFYIQNNKVTAIKHIS